MRGGAVNTYKGNHRTCFSYSLLLLLLIMYVFFFSFFHGRRCASTLNLSGTGPRGNTRRHCARTPKSHCADDNRGGPLTVNRHGAGFRKRNSHVTDTTRPRIIRFQERRREYEKISRNLSRNINYNHTVVVILAGWCVRERRSVFGLNARHCHQVPYDEL